MNQENPLSVFKKDLRTALDAKELALPDTVSPSAFRNAAIVAVQDNPLILQCGRDSVFKAIRTLAAAGLVPDGREAAIVPFKKQAQAMPMVFGIIKAARNSGGVKTLWAEVVYEGENFTVGIENGERAWSHTQEDGSPIDAMARGGNVKGAYAVAKLSDGTVDCQPMSLQEIEKRRKASANQKGPNPTGIWEKWYEEMAKKTVIRNLAKRLPVSSEDMNRLMMEQDNQNVRDVTPTEEPRQNLAQRLTEPKVITDPETDETPPQGPDMEPDSILEGEIVTEYDADTVDPFSDAYTEGVKAHQAAMKPEHNPHDAGTPDWNNWLGGYEFQNNQKRDEPNDGGE